MERLIWKNQDGSTVLVDEMKKKELLVALKIMLRKQMKEQKKSFRRKHEKLISKKYRNFISDDSTELG